MSSWPLGELKKCVVIDRVFNPLIFYSSCFGRFDPFTVRRYSVPVARPRFARPRLARPRFARPKSEVL